MNPKIKLETLRYLSDPKNKVLLAALAIFLLAAVFKIFLTPSDTPAKLDSLAATADTVIPAGYVLIPIELENASAMNSLIGDFGIVDLFSAKTDKVPRGLKVGTRLKLIKAPLNPDQYAVLVREQDSSALLEARGPFFAVIQNPDIRTTASVLKKERTRKSRVDYFNEGGF